jgi:hypothetical protein
MSPEHDDPLDRRIEAALRAAPAARAPAALAARVMAEVARTSQQPAAPPGWPVRLASRGALGLWSAAGLAVAGLGWLALEGPGAASGALARGGPAVPGTAAALGAWLDAAVRAAPGPVAGVALIAAAGLTWASWQLTRAVEAAALGRNRLLR